MSDLDISKIQCITPHVLHQVLRSPNISQTDKIQFIRKNSAKIKNVLDINLTPNEYRILLGAHPLVKGHLVRNVAIKRGDKILLAKTLNIPVTEVSAFIKNVQEPLKNEQKIKDLSPSTIKAIRTYIYRNGSNEQLGIFFNNELAESKNILKTLSRTLSYHNGGVADYFLGPMHKMRNSTLVNLYHIIDKNLTKAVANGQITEIEYTDTLDWALKQIYQIQHNSSILTANKVK